MVRAAILRQPKSQRRVLAHLLFQTMLRPSLVRTFVQKRPCRSLTWLTTRAVWHQRSQTRQQSTKVLINQGIAQCHHQLCISLLATSLNGQSPRMLPQRTGNQNRRKRHPALRSRHLEHLLRSILRNARQLLHPGSCLNRQCQQQSMSQNHPQRRSRALMHLRQQFLVSHLKAI